MQYNEIFYKQKSFFLAGRSDDLISKHHINNHIFYESETLNNLENILSIFKNKPISIIDAGANIGNHSIFFGDNFSNSKVFSFEMNPETFNYLEANINKNNLNNVIAINMGLSNSLGKCGIKPNKDNPLGGAQLDMNCSLKNVQLTTIDHFFYETAKGIDAPKVTLIKIDVEGFEVQCLEGAKKILKRDKPMIFLECKEVWQFKDILNLLEPLGYKIIEPAVGALPNFMYVHKNHLKEIYSEKNIYDIIKDLSFRHVQSWQMHRDINQLKKQIKANK